jgi:hypothetical protein
MRGGTSQWGWEVWGSEEEDLGLRVKGMGGRAWEEEKTPEMA